LRDFTGLSTSTITQKQTIPIGVDWSVIRWHLEGMYGEVEEGLDDEKRNAFTVSLLALGIAHL
jgi:cleavage and polyadenylation specificity factor subunit 3